MNRHYEMRILALKKKMVKNPAMDILPVYGWPFRHVDDPVRFSTRVNVRVELGVGLPVYQSFRKHPKRKTLYTPEV